MRYIFQEEKIDTVIHFAAQSHVGKLQLFIWFVKSVTYDKTKFMWHIIARAFSEDAWLKVFKLAKLTSGDKHFRIFTMWRAKTEYVIINAVCFVS